MPNATSKQIETVRSSAHSLTGAAEDYDPLMALIGDARFVLIGEATHGTYEFYEQRVEITKRLIQEKGFTAVAVEADFPDAYRVNRYVRGINDDATPEEALRSFQRFPTWMWRTPLSSISLVGCASTTMLYPRIEQRWASMGLTSTVCIPRSKKYSSTSIGLTQMLPDARVTATPALNNLKKILRHMAMLPVLD
jgi:hypothetical protein